MFLKKEKYLYFLLWIAGITFNSCSPKSTTSTLPVGPPEDFSYSGSAELPEEWWTAFGNPQLNSIMQEALDSNFNLLTAWERINAAHAVVERESASLLPTLEATAQSALNYPQPDFVGGENIRFGLASFYEVDLWGRIRATVEAEEYRAEAAFLDYKAAAISLSAEISLIWYQLQALWQQLELLEEQIKTNEKILTLIKAQFGSGQVRSVDILRQKQLAESTREQKILLEGRIQVLEHQLAVLKGDSPQEEIRYRPDTLPTLPPLPATGLPAELIERRPDVQFSFRLLQAADREVAAAVSSKYPRLSISTSLSARSNEAQGLFQDLAYSLAANLAAPLFYGGSIRAEIDRTEAVKQQRLYEYGQTILGAFQDVEDALIQEIKQQESIEILEEQVMLAEKAYNQLRYEYFNGMSDYLSVLTALNQEQQLRRDLILSKFTLLEYRISLYRALAGGFQTDRENSGNDL